MKLEVIVFLAVAMMAEASIRKDVACEPKFTKVGCFDEVPKPEAIEMINDRDRTSKVFSGRMMKWKHYTVHSLACRCNEMALAKGYEYFTIRFYGECWGVKKAAMENWIADESHVSVKCVDKKYQPCGLKNKHECAGKAEMDYVYKRGPVLFTCAKTYTKKGCFAETHPSKELFNDRDTTSLVYSGQMIDWKNFRNYIYSMACRCNAKAVAGGYDYFTLRFHAECWGVMKDSMAPTLEKNQKSLECVNEKSKPCKSKDPICVGKESNDFVFKPGPVLAPEFEVVCDLKPEGGCKTWEEHGLKVYSDQNYNNAKQCYLKCVSWKDENCAGFFLEASKGGLAGDFTCKLVKEECEIDKTQLAFYNDMKTCMPVDKMTCKLQWEGGCNDFSNSLKIYMDQDYTVTQCYHRCTSWNRAKGNEECAGFFIKNNFGTAWCELVKEGCEKTDEKNMFYYLKSDCAL